MSFGIFDEKLPVTRSVTFDDSTFGTPANLTLSTDYTTRLDTIVATNDDVADHVLGVFMDMGSGPVHFAAVNIPAGSGEPGVANVDVLAEIWPITSPGLWFGQGTVLGFAQYDALGAGKKIRVVGIGGLC